MEVSRGGKPGGGRAEVMALWSIVPWFHAHPTPSASASSLNSPTWTSKMRKELENEVAGLHVAADMLLIACAKIHNLFLYPLQKPK